MMNYYRAREQDSLPRVVFDLVAASYEELIEKGLEDDQLVVSEDRLLDPSAPGYIEYQFGMCTVRIQNGKLEPTDTTVAGQNYYKAMQRAKTEKLETNLENATFSFDGNDFPLTDPAMKFYDSIAGRGLSAPKAVISLQGVYSLTPGNLEDFLDSYYQKVQQVYGTALEE